MSNIYEDEGILTDQEARNLLCRLAGTGSGLMLSLSLAVNTCYAQSKGDSEKANELLKALFNDYQKALTSMFDRSMSDAGVRIRRSDGSTVVDS